MTPLTKNLTICIITLCGRGFANRQKNIDTRLHHFTQTINLYGTGLQNGEMNSVRKFLGLGAVGEKHKQRRGLVESYNQAFFAANNIGEI